MNPLNTREEQNSEETYCKESLHDWRVLIFVAFYLAALALRSVADDAIKRSSRTLPILHPDGRTFAVLSRVWIEHSWRLQASARRLVDKSRGICFTAVLECEQLATAELQHDPNIARLRSFVVDFLDCVPNYAINRSITNREQDPCSAQVQDCQMPSKRWWRTRSTSDTTDRQDEDVRHSPDR